MVTKKGMIKKGGITCNTYNKIKGTSREYKTIEITKYANY